MIDLLTEIRQNWSPLEVGWTIVAVLGIIVSSRALSRATSLTIFAVRDGMEWPTRRRLLKRIRDAAGAYARHIGFFIVGIAAMASPKAPQNPDVDYTPGLAVAIVFIGVIIWDIVSLYWDERDWSSIVRAMVKDETLWQRLVSDEERVQARVAEQLGETLPLRTQTDERNCP